MLSRSDKLKRRKINKFLSFIVICVTLSILILPAFTLEKKDDDTNDNNDPSTAQNVNKQGGSEALGDSTLEPVVNNNTNDESSSEDDVLVVGETGDDEPMLLAESGTTTTTGYDLSANPANIDSISFSYKDGDNWVAIDTNTGSSEIPGDRELRLSVNYKNVLITDLKTIYNRKLTFDIPELLRNAKGEGDLMNGNVHVGTLTVQNGKAILEFDEGYLNSITDEHIGGDFYVSGKADLSKLDENGKANITLANKEFKFNFGPDAIAKYGEVKVDKKCVSSKTISINGEDYLEYSITVTAGEDGSPDVTIVDDIVVSKNLIDSFVEITNVKTSLGTTRDGLKPFDTMNTGFVYLGNSPTTENPIPQELADFSGINKPGILVWKVGDLGKNESRTLTYFVKLKGDVSIRNNTIKNKANVYSKNYDKKTYAEASFTPKLSYNMSKNDGKLYSTEYVIRNDDGTYTISYKLLFTLNKNGSNYPIKDFTFYDYLNYNDQFHTNIEILPFVNYNPDSIEVFKKTESESDYSKLDPTKFVVSWSNDRNNYYENWGGPGDPKCFKVNGSTGNPFVLNPGDSYYVTYTVNVKADALATLQSNEAEVVNRFYAFSERGYMDRVFNKQKTTGYTWNEKTVSEALSDDKTITIDGDKFLLNEGGVSNDFSTTSSFIVPKGSYEYSVRINQTLNDWDVTGLTMSDTMTPNDMQYVEYMKIEAFEYDTNTKNYISKGTKWVKIDGLNSFSLKLNDLDWNNNKYAYTFTYYAKPVNQGNYAVAQVNNEFNINGDAVGRDGLKYKLNISSTKRVEFTGTYKLDVKKTDWYYEEPITEASSWKNGKIYWIVEIDSSIIKKDVIFKDSIMTGSVGVDGANYTDSYMHEDSLLVYQGKLDDGKSITDYKNLKDLQDSGKFINITDKFKKTYEDNVSGNNYKTLLIQSNEDISLGDERAFFIIASEPSTIPTKYRDYKYYGNKISTKENNGAFVDRGNAKKLLCRGGEILKELGSTFKYDGKDITTITSNRVGAIANNGLKGPGVYASWAFKLNYAGDLSGSYRVLETIPNGMEITYLRIKWIAAKQYANGGLNSNKITNIGDGWEERTITANMDSNGSITTTYYVKGNQALIELGNFIAGHERDNYAADVQVVCRVTDPRVLLDNKEISYTNTVELKTTDGKTINTATSDAKIQFENISKNFVSSGEKINFTIVANPLGQVLPTQANSTKIKLIDKLSTSLSLDTTTIEVVNTKTNEKVTNDCKAALKEDNTLEIEIPNNVPLKITYTALVNAPPGEPVSFSNVAYWEGYTPSNGSSVNQDSYSYVAGGTVTTGTSITLKIVKKNQNNLSQVLEGAEFKVVKCTRINEGIFSEDSTVELNGITASDGTLIFGETGTVLEYNTVYKVTETKAPNGYVADSTPKYIMVAKKESGTDYSEYVKKCINDPRIKVQYQKQYELQVFNSRGVITIEKKFKNAGGHDTGPISGTYWFGLYDGPEATNQLQKISITYDPSDTTSTTSKTNKFVDLDLSQTYYVYELDASGKPIKDSNTVNVINGMEYLTSYTINSMKTNAAGNGNTVIVTNQVVTKQLPATGGNGTDIYIKSGAILMLLTVVVLLKRRR